MKQNDDNEKNSSQIVENEIDSIKNVRDETNFAQNVIHYENHAIQNVIHSEIDLTLSNGLNHTSKDAKEYDSQNDHFVENSFSSAVHNSSVIFEDNERSKEFS